MKINRFEDLDIWKESLIITRNIYDLLAKKEFNLEFELKNQIKRAILSVSSNVVEGFEKNNNNEFIRFLKIAKGSVGETRNQLYIALVVRYITEQEFKKVNSDLESLAGQIGGFIIYLQRKRNSGEFLNKKIR